MAERSGISPLYIAERSGFHRNVARKTLQLPFWLLVDDIARCREPFEIDGC